MKVISNKKIKIYISSKSSNSNLEEISYNDLKSNKQNLNKLTIHEGNLKQRFMGFGGAFTEASASIYAKLSNDNKKNIINSYFGNKDGNW